VQVAPSDHLTPVEEIALRAVGHGAENFIDLENILGLGRRMTLDLLQDLWRSGYIRVNIQKAQVILAPEVARIINQPQKLRELKPGRVEEEIWSLGIDVIAGRVVPLEDTRGAGDVLVAPRPNIEWSAKSVPQQELLSAVMSSQRIRFGDSPGARAILGVDLTPRRVTAQSGLRVLHVIVAAWRDEQGKVQARVSPDERIPPIYRQRIDHFLAEQLEAPDGSRFVQAISDRATDRYAEPPGLAERLQRFRDRIARLDQALPGTWPDHHVALQQLRAQLEREVEARETAATPATLSTSADDQFQQVIEAIGKARHQVVLVGPWVEFEPLNELLDSLLAAMRKGVRVVIAWGYDHEDELPEGVATVLISARDQFPGRLVFSDRSARTHAKLAVCDDRWALVTSLNLLGSLRKKVEAGVIVTAAGAAPWSAVEELLRWVRDDCYPDYPEARGLLVSSESFRRVPDSRPRQVNEVTSAPPAVGDPADEQAVAARRSLWQQEWEVIADSLEARARLLPVHVDGVVIDAMHRSELNDALLTAERRLVITSDQLSPEIVSDRFLANVDELLRQGVHVRLIYGRWSKSHDPGNERVRTALTRFTRAYGDRFAEREVPNWHAKVLVRDNRVLVGSFNFLSFEGHYREGRRSRRSELSVSLAGGDVADQFAEAICSLAGLSAPPVVSPATPTPLRAVGTATSQSRITDIQAARWLLEAAPVERGTVVGDLPLEVDLNALLILLEDMGAHASDIAEIAAAILCSGRSGDALADWADRLVANLWEQRRFVEAMLIREHYGGDGRPSRFVTALGAFAGSVSFDEWLGTIELTTLTQPDRVAIAIVAAAETLMPESASQNNAPVVLDELVEGQADTRLPAVVLAYSRRYGPLTAEVVARELARTEHRQQIRELIAKARETVVTWQAGKPPGQDGTRVRAYLNRDRSPAGHLLDALQAGEDGSPDRVKLQTWYDEYGQNGGDALYSRIEVDAGGHARTKGSRRVDYVNRSVQPVVDSVATLLTELDIETETPSTQRTMLQPILAELTPELAQLEDVVRGLPHDLQIAVERSVERFRRLTETDRQ
jgi:phosphatidylserine/phosphatidylglycerophosphate/cardiolipin synthase-like enzyme